MYRNLFSSAVFEIKEELKPTFKRPYLPLKLQNKINVVGLYDTGADISCISEKVFEEIPKGNRPQPVATHKQFQFKGAGGDALKVKGRFLCSVLVDNKKMEHEFYVVKGLSESVILGIDFIGQHELSYCPRAKRFSWKDEAKWQKGHLKVNAAQKLEPLSVNFVKVSLRTDSGCMPKADSDCVVQVASSEHPLLTGGPYLVRPDSQGQAMIAVHNCSPVEVELERNDFIGMIEEASDWDKREVNPAFIQAVSQGLEKKKSPVTKEKEEFIRANLQCPAFPEWKEKIMQVVLKNHECVSLSKFDLGRTETLLHEISLKTEEPVYVKQFKIPDAHREEVEKHVKEWLKLGVIQPARSKYNSPIFAVMKKNGGVRLVQDFRALNAHTHVDKYSMKDVSECIGEIGRAGSFIFSTIDLTGGFWQMLLHPRSRPYTAFTVPGQGQFQWVTSPMGLLGCPSSFQRLMETVVHGIQDVIVYIDDLLLHSGEIKDHLQLIDTVLGRLVQHGVKINLQKCVFMSQEVAYLGFKLTPEGIKPGEDKLKAVAQAKPPSSVHEVRQFLGLCNFFRGHVRNFAQISAPLACLTRKDCGWKGGTLPQESLTAFKELQSCLCSEPVVDYPRKGRPYSLITDASLGDDKKPGGLGAILTQEERGEQVVIAYASRKLQKHERNYTPYLLEMQAAIWGMEHFSTYLRGRHFTLYTDHKPLEKLGKVHTKTLNRLQEAMNTFDFKIVYKKGSEMPADYLSRNLVASISWNKEEFAAAQEQSILIKALKNFLLNGELPKEEQLQGLVRHFGSDCFVEDDLVWRRVKRTFEPSRVVLFLPKVLMNKVLEDAHGHLLSGHDGIYKTKERIFQCFYWPGMDKDIGEHLSTCHKCQERKGKTPAGPALLTPLPQCSEPNQRIHADLFGPLRTSGNSKKFILCMTDAFTKYVELVALGNKEAPTVATAIFERWFCRFGIPLEVVTDQGSEFCARLTEDLFKLMQTSHLKTTAYHPQCNSQAEVANKTIAKYLASFVSDSTLDWEDYLAPLMFSYNTSFHRSIKTCPFNLTFGMEARHPCFPTPDLRTKFYGESSTDELMHRLLLARDIARRNNEAATEKNEADFNKKATAHPFQLHQLVMLDEHSFLSKNRKLAPKWTGPHRVVKIKNDNNLEIKLRCHGKNLIVHANRLKPYLVPMTGRSVFPETTELRKLKKKKLKMFCNPKKLKKKFLKNILRKISKIFTKIVRMSITIDVSGKKMFIFRKQIYQKNL